MYFSQRQLKFRGYCLSHVSRKQFRSVFFSKFIFSIIYASLAFFTHLYVICYTYVYFLFTFPSLYLYAFCLLFMYVSLPSCIPLIFIHLFYFPFFISLSCCTFPLFIIIIIFNFSFFSPFFLHISLIYSQLFVMHVSPSPHLTPLGFHPTCVAASWRNKLSPEEGSVI